jgi:polyisoprenoid-binding protein YceI
VFKSLGIAALALLLVSCGAPRPRPVSPQVPPAPSAPSVPPLAPPAGTTVYRIDPDQSELRVLVYRAGAIAKFGHNHVIANRMLTGRIDFGGTATASSFSIDIPVAGFFVDDEELRRQEGPDFPGEIPADAKEGTLHNMLSPALLDASEYPVITVRGANITGTNDTLTATLTVSVAGHESMFEAPFTLEADAGRLSVAGTLELLQSTLGLAPFSVMMGALQVRDDMRLRFKIVAIAT